MKIESQGSLLQIARDAITYHLEDRIPSKLQGLDAELLQKYRDISVRFTGFWGGNLIFKNEVAYRRLFYSLSLLWLIPFRRV